MSSVLWTISILCLIGNFEARQPDIDINRIILLPKEVSRPGTRTQTPSGYHGRRSIKKEYNYINHDNDYSGSGVNDQPPPMHLLHETSTSAKGIKIHKPREDPRLFYQSDEYLKKIAGKDINNEVSFIYPGREVIRANNRRHHSRAARLRTLGNIEDNNIDPELICVRCPHDRTLIVRNGSNQVVLQYPRLQSCTSRTKLPKNVRFIHMYGPNFGSLLEQGSHIVVGRITHNNKHLQICKMQIHVLAQTCPTPKYLVARCEDGNQKCNFTCRNPKHDLHGESTLSCEENGKWSGKLPICKARTWCEPPPPPDHGRVSCKGATTTNGVGLLEGSNCRVRCSRGWRWFPRAATFCRHGAWTHELTCLPKRN